MGPSVRSKKMAVSDPLEVAALAGHNNRKMVRIEPMADRILRLDRRKLLAGMGAAVLTRTAPGNAAPQARLSLTLRAEARALALTPGQPASPIWSLAAVPPDPALRLARGDELEITLQNELPLPIALDWHGIDGVASTEPLLARPPLAAGASETLAIVLRQAGTLLCDLRLTGDAAARPLPARALVVAESEPVAVDGDEVFLIEDWRLRADGTAIAPGTDPDDTTPLYTVNGETTLDVTARAHQRLRFRFINGCQRAVIAVKMEARQVRVMALDSQPAEPFFARNGAIVLAPGGRADAFIDVGGAPGAASSILLHDGMQARPIGRLIVSSEPPFREAALPEAPALPSNGLPALLDLRGALRIDVALADYEKEWTSPAHFTASAPPAFRAGVGRTVVLALTNRGKLPAVFHLHGHHFRLLDRLDDGWKPFWLDTLVVDGGETQRIAFAAEHAGRWLLEAVATDWTAPRLVRWYSVE